MKDYKTHDEVLEDLIEDWAFNNVKDGQFKCPSCKHWKKFSDVEQGEIRPYSLPFCKDCSKDKRNININVKD